MQSNEGGAFFCRASQIVRPLDGWINNRSDRAALAGPKQLISRAVGVGNPFCHHFSWAKPLDQMIRKVKSWAHKDDRKNWVEMLRAEWALPLPSQTDFVHHKPVVACSNPLEVVIP